MMKRLSLFALMFLFAQTSLAVTGTVVRMQVLSTNGVTLDIDVTGWTIDYDTNYVGTVTISNGDVCEIPDGGWHGLGAEKGRIVFTDADTDFLSVMGARFGVGTLTPRSAMDLNGDINFLNSNPTILGRDDDGSLIISAGDASNDGANLIMRGATGTAATRFDITFRRGGTATVFIDGGNSYVGLDTSSPVEMLDVSGAIALSDTNDIPSAAAGMAKLYVTNSAAELWVIDASGNRTQLSAHDGDIPIERSQNDFTGRSYWRNKWTGDETKSWALPRDTWAAREERQNQRVEEARTVWTTDKAAFDAWTGAEPERALAPELYAAALAAWQAQTVEDPGQQPAKYAKKPTPQWVTSGLEENPNVE